MAQNASPPLIPEKYLDIPSQRFYVLSLACLCQSIKIVDFVRSFAYPDSSFTRKWLLVDLLFCIILSQLRIPRLKYGKPVILLHICLLWFMNGLMFGGLRLHIFENSSTMVNHFDRQNLPSSQSLGILATISSSVWGLLSSPENTNKHLLGQHTVLLSPISTARINPEQDTFCLASTQPSVLIPILLNNTDPAAIRYTVTPLGYDPSSPPKTETFDLSAKDLKLIEAARLASQPSTHPSSHTTTDHDSEYDDDEEDEHPSTIAKVGSILLQKTQSLVHIQVSKPGIVKLERVIDASLVDSRLGYVSEVVVAPCPQVEWAEPRSPEQLIRCSGDDPDLQLSIEIYGVPPLSLRWEKSINNKVQPFLVEGIESDDPPVPEVASDDAANQQLHAGVNRSSQKVIIPLTVSLDSVGTHEYRLQEVVDGIGNIVNLGGRVSQSTRSIRLLRRPAVSFKQCGPAFPKTLLMGAETTLAVSANDADPLDSPWEVSYTYRPNDGAKSKHTAYRKKVKTEGSRRDLTFSVNAPGQYNLESVKGRYCEGDILAPDACPVIEKPYPIVEVEWQKIHECSGDTGVSASLVLHGTPPFIVYYRMRRDKQPPVDMSKTFTSSRGELSIQPQDEGHFIFSIMQVSDAHYQRVDIQAPSIDQIIHPLASAEFVQTGRGRRRISSCGGNKVDVQVELKGTGPWNVEIQIVDSKGTNTMTFEKIENARSGMQIPIPHYVDRHGGSFDIALASVTDHSGCKRSLAVNGITVNVRRILPTVKFYGQESKRRATVLEKQDATLPLRLTGDGPWEVKYRNQNTRSTNTAQVHSPNDVLIARDPGLYELLEVRDSECLGSVAPDGATYLVDWVPKPSIQLSPQTKAEYIPYNGTYILPSICEGLLGHVDLELTGRSPFQIMYNIAQQNENGGTNILDQPVFNTIQKRTRFELRTQNPGRFFYEVKQIGDAAYPLEKTQLSIIPRDRRLLFEQHVHRRPMALFFTRERLTYCLHDVFMSPDTSSMMGTIRLEGIPPFTLTVSIRNLGVSEIESISVVVDSHSWRIDVPSYRFETVGAYLVTIESVYDSTGCAHGVLDPALSSIWVDVAETALIVPMDRREDYCLGDVSSFQMEGTPPWTIGYRINGKSHSQIAHTSPFSLIQQHTGQFMVTSIAHQQSRCRSAVTDLQFNVHSLPYAKVGNGQRFVQDIHEGDQAEIVFTLEGEPPFTFTYQRAEPQKRGSAPGKVLETHTVSRVMSYEYSIFSAQEGTWTVTSIADKYCRYPSQIEG